MSWQVYSVGNILQLQITITDTFLLLQKVLDPAWAWSSEVVLPVADHGLLSLYQQDGHVQHARHQDPAKTGEYTGFRCALVVFQKYVTKTVNFSLNRLFLCIAGFIVA